MTDAPSLTGPWRLYFYPEAERVLDTPMELMEAGLEPIEARVPGNVELDLVRAGMLPDPFVGVNIHRLREYEHHAWWYVTEFEGVRFAEGETCELVFHGLDCLAEVWLNGRRVGEAANMLVEHRFDVTEALNQDGTNQLAVHIRSAVNAARQFDYPPSLAAFPTSFEHLHIRKAPHMYGWDIAPRAVSAGIWRPVELDVAPKERVTDLAFATVALQGTDALVQVSWRFDTDAPSLEGYRVRLRGVCGDHVFTQDEPAHFTAGMFRFTVEDARLWRPKGHGEPHLYELTFELLRDGAVVARRTETAGVRTIELERSEVTTEGGGGQFLFRVNGEPVFCKGSNWVPLDAFHSRDAERLQAVLELCEDLGCNMLRCWGGNVYEDHAFFDFCDRHGILVWQDFAFACALYPQNDAFLRSVRAEAEAVVKKLRNHASLALWAGDNEIDMAYLQRGLDPAKNRISREVLPRVCAEQDPYRVYLPSSPYASPEVTRRCGGADQRLMPEQHLWGPRDYFKGPYYAHHTAHFASEMGYHGCPNVSSIKRFVEPDRLWPWQDNVQWHAHSTDPVPEGGPFAYRTKLMADQTKELFGEIPSDFEAFALASQISQAEAKKFFIESFRLAKWRRTGILWWNVMDCWPQFSDAIVDYYFGKKLAYWYIKRSQAPVCVMVDEPAGWRCRVAVSNDTLEDAEGRYSVTDAETGEELLGGAYEAPANATTALGAIPVSHGEHRLFLIRWDAGGREYGSHYFLGKPPFSLDWYRERLRDIASLPEGFDPEAVAR